MDKQLLPEELVREHAEQTVKKAEKVWNIYHRGMLLFNELYDRLLGEVFYEGVYDFLENRGLKMDMMEDRFACFQKDMETFRKGSRQEEGSFSPWLFTRDKKEAACLEDHRQVLLLLDLLYLPAEYFEPFLKSPGVTEPENVYAHGYSSCDAYFIRYTCRDDGGLLSDPSPVGKTFTLTDHYGLKSVLTITKVRSFRYRTEPDYDAEYILAHPESFPSGIEYLAEGSIEGYTEVPRTNSTEIRVHVRRGQIEDISYYEYLKDCCAFREFPLWQPYIKERRAFEEKRKSIFVAAVKKLDQGTAK